MSGGTRKLSLSFDARDKISDQALRDEKMKNQDKLLSFFFFLKSGFFLNLFSRKAWTSWMRTCVFIEWGTDCLSQQLKIPKNHGVSSDNGSLEGPLLSQQQRSLTVIIRWCWLAHETLGPTPWRLPSVRSVWDRALVLWTPCLSLKDSRCNEAPDGNNKYHSDFPHRASYSGAFVEGNRIEIPSPTLSFPSSPLSLLGSQPPLESKG